MTVSTAQSRVAHLGNNVTVLFPVPFPFIQDEYLTVVRTNNVTLVATPLILNSGGANGYTVQGAGNPTGSVTVVTAPTAFETLSIFRVVPATQEADFVANDPFPAETFEDSLDKLTMIVGQAVTDVGRSLKLFDGDTDGSGRYNANGNRVVGLAEGVNGTDAATVSQLIGAGSGNFIQAGVGAVTRTMQNKVRESVSVKDFGAAGDGFTDDSAAVQLALDTGADVYIDEGTYIVTELSTSAVGQQIYGEGTLKKKAAVDGVTLTLAHDKCHVVGVRFDGTNPQPSPTAINNIINITANDCQVVGCEINGSAGGGVTMASPSSRNVVAYNIIKNTDDNNVMVSGAEANDNLVLGNYLDGTTQQNNIFITASPASTPTADYNYRTRVIGNTCLNSGDTAIEAGIHSVGVVIMGNTCRNSRLPEILLRDCLDCIVVGNVVEAGSNGDAGGHDGIAVIKQTETDWRYKAVIANNRVTGKITRAAIYISDAHDVIVDGNYLEETFATVNATTGAGLVGQGVSIGDNVDDVAIRNNVVRRFLFGINMNFAAASPTHNRIDVVGNRIFEAGTGISVFQTTTVDSRITDNAISKLVTQAFSSNSANGSNSTIIARNTISLSGYSGAAPFRFSNPDLGALGIYTAEEVSRAVVPENQFSSATLATVTRRSVGILSIQFEDNSEEIVLAVSRTATAKLTGTANMLDSTGSGGFAGWSAFYDGSNNLIFQRRGANTGLGPRSFRFRFTRINNET